MTTLRFDFQRDQVSTVQKGVVLNVGANEDPASLKAMENGDRRVVNCDLFDFDETLERPNNVEVIFDCARDRWPFDDDYAEMVVMGDIVEHLSEEEQVASFKEAHRVARKLVITCPEDGRPETFEDRSDLFPRGAVHVTLVTEELLRKTLEASGWEPRLWETPNYGFVPRGHFVVAVRK